MGSRWWLWAILAAVTALAGCGWIQDVQIGPKDQRDAAQRFIALFATKDVHAIKMQLDDRIKGSVTDATIRNIIAILPSQKPTHIQIYRWATYSGSEGRLSRLNLLYRYPNGNALAAVVTLASAADGYRVYGINFPADTPSSPGSKRVSLGSEADR